MCKEDFYREVYEWDEFLQNWILKEVKEDGSYIIRTCKLCNKVNASFYKPTTNK